MRFVLDVLLATATAAAVALVMYTSKAWLGLEALAREHHLTRAQLLEGLAQLPKGELAPTTVLLAGATLPALALGLLVLAPAWVGLRRWHGTWPRWRQTATWTAIGAFAAGVLLESIDPVLSRPEVPLGPRSFLNAAFELVGYGWVNALAYASAIAGALVFGLRRRGAQAARASVGSTAATMRAADQPGT